MIRLRAHLVAMLLALLVGILYAGPDVYHTHTPGYQGVVMADSGDADFYLSLINKNYISSSPVGDPFQYEYRDLHNPFQLFLIEFALGKVGSFFHLSIGALLIAMEFLFPALLTLLLYGFIYQLSKSRLAGSLGAGAMLLGNELVRQSNIHDLVSTFLLQGPYREFLAYSRPVNPQVSSIFLFGAVWTCFYLLQHPRSKVAVALAGFAVGALAYIYVYAWAFAFVVLGVVFLYALLSRRWQLLCAAGGAILISVLGMTPFLVANIPLLVHGGQSGLTQAIATHKPIVEKMILLPLFLYACIWLYSQWGRGGRVLVWARAFREKYLFVLLLLVSGLIVSNQQILTGKVIFQQHFHFYTNIPVFLLAISLLVAELCMYLPRVWRIVCVAGALALLVGASLGVQIASYRAHEAEALRNQALAPIWAYLQKEAPRDSVVLSNAYLSTRLTIQTQGFSYATGGYDVTYAVPKERLLHDYFSMLALRGVTKDSIRSYIYQKNNRDEIGGTLFIGTYWRDLCGSSGCFPDSVLEDLIPQYKIFLTQPFLGQLKKYKIDFVLWDEKNDPQWYIEKITTKPPVVQSGNYSLYRIP